MEGQAFGWANLLAHEAVMVTYVVQHVLVLQVEYPNSLLLRSTTGERGRERGGGREGERGRERGRGGECVCTGEQREFGPAAPNNTTRPHPPSRSPCQQGCLRVNVANVDVWSEVERAD